MLQNDKINCNGSFWDITMHFVTDPCVNVSILWIIIMYHVKPSCCTTPKIHWDMSNFLVHLKASWETVVWRCLEVKQEDGNGTAALLLRASRALFRAGNRWDVPTTLTPQPCPHSVWCNGTLCWEGALARQNWPLPLTPGCPHSPQDRPGPLWNRPRSVTRADPLTENPDFQMRPTAMEQQHQIHELETRQKLNQKPPPMGTQLNQEAPLTGTPASTGGQIKMTH